MKTDLDRAKYVLAQSKATMTAAETMLAQVRDLFVQVAAGKLQLSAAGALRCANHAETVRKAAREILDQMEVAERAAQVLPSSAPTGVM